ncbi:MAG: hypothetical protein J0I90_00400, partial [Nitrosospira sp.]|nr:hypothetical protein [Nitrosospira sp.]
KTVLEGKNNQVAMRFRRHPRHTAIKTVFDPLEAVLRHPFAAEQVDHQYTFRIQSGAGVLRKFTHEPEALV